MSPAAATSADFVISRLFDAPRELVWKVFTDENHMKSWWGPRGFTVFHSKMDLRPGGTYHYGLKAPDGGAVWGKFVYREIAAPERIAFVISFSDDNGGVTRHPMAPVWPLQWFSVLTFEDVGGKTKLTVRWSLLEATPEERKAFDAGHDDMRGGWGGTFEDLADYLAKIGKT